MSDNRYKELEKIKTDVLNLTESPLYLYRKKNSYLPVIGEGDHHAKIMFIGEAPGLNEAKQGKPFCGAAGRILNELLQSVKIKREDVYISNIVKDRPPDNRDPLPKEIEIYSPFLDRQINIIQPKIIATLGRFSMEYIMRKFGLENKLQTISKIHGQTFTAKTDYGEVAIIPLFHPATVLYQASRRSVLEKDFLVLNNFGRTY